MSSPPRTKRDIPPRLPSKKQRSQSLTPSQSQIKRMTADKHNSGDGVTLNGDLISYDTNIMQHGKCTSTEEILNNSDENHEPNIQMTMTVDQKQHSADGVINGDNLVSKSTGNIVKDLRFTSNSLPRNQIINNGRQIPPRASSLSRNTSNSSLTKIPSEEIPPPKPVKDRGKDDPVHRVASYHASGSDSGNGSGDSAQSLPNGEDISQNRCSGVIIKNPRFMPNSMSSITLKSFADIDPIAAEETLRSMEIPYIEQMSQFDMENFHTVLLPCSDFRPLDSGTLTTFRMMISETSPRIIALTITRVDIKLILGKNFS